LNFNPTLSRASIAEGYADRSADRSADRQGIKKRDTLDVRSTRSSRPVQRLSDPSLAAISLVSSSPRNSDGFAPLSPAADTRPIEIVQGSPSNVASMQRGVRNRCPPLRQLRSGTSIRDENARLGLAQSRSIDPTHQAHGRFSLIEPVSSGLIEAGSQLSESAAVRDAEFHRAPASRLANRLSRRLHGKATRAYLL